MPYQSSIGSIMWRAVRGVGSLGGGLRLGGIHLFFAVGQINSLRSVQASLRCGLSIHCCRRTRSSVTVFLLIRVFVALSLSNDNRETWRTTQMKLMQAKSKPSKKALGEKQKSKNRPWARLS